MIEPRRALVRPRVLSPITGEALLLEDAVLDAIRQAPGVPIQILGAAGAGKTTALHHLRAVLAETSSESVGADFVFLDEPSLQELIAVHIPKTVVFATPVATFGDAYWHTLNLAPWTEDDLMEYLLARHKSRCGEILAELRQHGGPGPLHGIPELCTFALDALAEHRARMPLDWALRTAFLAMLSGADREVAEKYGLEFLTLGFDANATSTTSILRVLPDSDVASTVGRLLRHAPLLQILAVGRIASDLAAGRPCHYLKTRLPQPVIGAVAEQIRDDAAAQARVRQFLTQEDASRHPMAASICHHLNPQWMRSFPNKKKPLVVKILPMLPIKDKPRRLNLCGAYLQNADWPGASLEEIDFSGADLSFANLEGASLEGAIAAGTNLSGAVLKGANLRALHAAQADFAQADLRQAKAPEAKIGQANFQGALLEGATFYRADCSQADFSRAQLTKTLFQDANLNGAILTEADLTAADLSRATLIRDDFRTAQFDGTLWHGATLVECNFEETNARRVDFSGAFLKGSLWTGSTLEEANFVLADLRNTGLANIDWEGANLKNADLRGASFHLGSSRSGLVGSPIAREGSMTGFYTDDFSEQEFKAPEEIRKANLRGADLRGANIQGVDFYLVDLRDAQYDAEQLTHFLACRAILRTRREL
jgi:uncharacterized protein YjbI with pentapeptide repeats